MFATSGIKGANVHYDEGGPLRKKKATIYPPIPLQLH